MKLNFTKFRQLNEGADYSIPHVEDLDVESFTRALKDLRKLRAVQKLDGANLRGGLDENGKFYTSREMKGGKRYYSQRDFPARSAYDGFRAAHDALSKVKPEIESVLAPGEAFNLEIIFGNQPNTVFYGKDNMNYIAFLEMLPGDDPSIKPDQKKLAKLMDLLKERTVAAKTEFWDTTDGMTMTRAPQLSDWRFTVSDRIPSDELDKINFESEIKELETFLSDSNEVAKQQGKDLSNYEVMKDKSRDLADERKHLNQKLTDDFKAPAKQKLLKLVYSVKPSLRGDVGASGAYDGIEGVIFTDPKTNEKFKVVDRDVFTKVNQFNYQVRNGVVGRITSADPNLPIEKRGGILGQARLRATKMFNLEGVELPQQTKKVLDQLRGDSRDETIKNIADSLHQLSFESLKRKLQAIYIATLDDLEESLDSFKIGAANYNLELENGQKITYTPEIKRRTLLTFAEARKEIIKILNAIRKCNYMEDVIELFFRKQLDDMHGGDGEAR